MMRAAKRPKVHVPSGLLSSEYVGKLYGYYHPDSNEYNVVAWGEHPEGQHNNVRALGEIFRSGEESTTDLLLTGTRTASDLELLASEERCIIEPYDLVQNIFSRNTGILETDLMLRKCAIISGCGSVGSLVALELARAGVGSFALIDNDTLAYHNLCRHQCGALDIGKYKVNAVKERIHEINPVATVETHVGIIEDAPKALFDKLAHTGAIVIGTADNREGDVYAGMISSLYRLPFVSIGLWERAFAGEIFYSIPGELPCYGCQFGGHNDGISRRASTNRRIYTDQADLAKVNFEPGISTDIAFVTLIAVKLIIDLLNRDATGYIPRILGHLSQYTLVANTCDTRLGGEQAEIFAYPLQVTTSINVAFSPPCPPCKYLS